jgi:peptide/nickel transport system substrate-binding protein
MHSQRFSRRAALRHVVFGLGATAAVGVLAACGSNAAPPAPTTVPAAAPKPPATAASTQAPAAAAPTSAPAPAPTTAAAAVKPGGSFVVALALDPQSMDPAHTGEPQARSVRNCVTEALFDLDASGKLIPRLAESWEQTDPTTYMLHLRKGVKFHDGTAFDAAAAKFNFDRMRDPATENVWASEITQLDSMEVVDPNTVRVKTKQPFAPALIPLYDVNGMQLSPAAVQRWGKDIGTHAVGTGPFKFVEYVKDDHVQLERNPDYWQQGQPKIDQLRFRVVPSDATRETELRSGGAHLVEYLPFQDVERLKAMNDIVVSEKPGFRVDWVEFQAEVEPGNNKLFRQAWNWLIDRDAIQNVVYRGTGAPGWDLLLPGTRFGDPTYKPTHVDLAKAKDLLQQSGVKLPIDLTTYIEQDPVRQREVQILQANVADAGINLKVEVLDTAAWNTRHKAGDFTLSLGWWGYRPDPDQYLPVNIRTGGSWNWARYSSPQIDDLLQQEEIQTDDAKRIQNFRQIAEIMTDDAVYIPYHYGSNIKGLTSKVQGFEHRVDGLVRFTNISLQA